MAVNRLIRIWWDVRFFLLAAFLTAILGTTFLERNLDHFSVNHSQTFLHRRRSHEAVIRRSVVPVSWSVVTAAVRPTPDDPRPVVAMARGAVCSTYLAVNHLASLTSNENRTSGANLLFLPLREKPQKFAKICLSDRPFITHAPGGEGSRPLTPFLSP